MLPKLKESVFAYRVALAGLVQEAQVSLQELFAFTLYILSQQPNLGQLKGVLAQPLPADDVQQQKPSGIISSNAHMRRSWQGSLRHAYASKRLSKCILQGVDETFVGMLDQQAASQAADADPLKEEETGRGGTQILWDRTNSFSINAEQLHDVTQHRPIFAHEHLSLLGAGLEQRSFALTQTSGQEATGENSETAFAVESQVHALKGSTQSKSRAMPHRPNPRPWMPYDSAFWAICADAVLRRVLKFDPTRRGEKLQAEQITALMERVVRMSRAGDFGPLVFEHPSFKLR